MHCASADDCPPDPRRPLWAPWRLDYIRAPRGAGCFICDKGRRAETGDHVLFRGRFCYVLMNDFPYNIGHLLVAPYRHCPTLTGLRAEERHELTDLLCQAQEVLERVLQASGFNVGFNIGQAAGAGLKEHVHGHVVPRWIGDTNFMPVLDGPRCLPEALDATCARLRQGWPGATDTPPAP